MKYVSTRGGVSGATFQQTLLSGYALDGGLYMPESLPRVEPTTLRAWAKLSYVQLVKEILPLYIAESEISRDQLHALIDRAFARFTHPDVLPLTTLSNGLNILEMFHGPTLAFKDLALACVGQFLGYFLSRSKQHHTLLVGTSGDTGSAAIESVRGLKWVDLVVLLPKGRCSRVQELQMTTVAEDNVHVYRVEGSSDDLDVPIKGCFMDEVLVKKHKLSSINSINWARVLVQIVPYFYAYLQLDPECRGVVEIVVPTGAAGNVTGGVIAREMGLPIKLVSAVNANDIIDRAFSRGDFSQAENVIETIAPSMNIQVPYNIERILYVVSGRDNKLIREKVTEFDMCGKTTLSPELVNKIQIGSCSVSDNDIRATMSRCWAENQYLLCPHTAVGVTYHYNSLDRDGPSSVPRVCFATASAVKFEEAVQSAGLTPQLTKAVEELATLPTRPMEMQSGQDWEGMLRQKLQDIQEKRK